jgi:hypothetical protein
MLALHIVPQIRYLGFSHLREDESLDYDGGFVRLQIQSNFDTNIHCQQQVCSGSSDGRMEANRDDLAAGSSAPDDLTVRQSIASEQLHERSCAMEATTSSTE